MKTVIDKLLRLANSDVSQCGCSPCMGACRSVESLMETVEQMAEDADTALRMLLNNLGAPSGFKEENKPARPMTLKERADWIYKMSIQYENGAEEECNIYSRISQDGLPSLISWRRLEEIRAARKKERCTEH